jgi:hypothetical protein
VALATEIPHRLRVAFSSAVDLDSSEGRTFLQSRLALFGQVGFIMAFTYFLLAYLSVYLSEPWSEFLRVFVTRWTVLHLSTSLAFLILWLACRTGVRPRWMLDSLDVGLLLVVCAVASLPPAFGRSVPEDAFALVLIVTHLLVIRAVYVPSSPKRTFWIGALVILVTMPGMYVYQVTAFVPRPGILPFTVQAGLWCLVALGGSVLASSIIFGLREKVREARQLGQYTLEEKLGEGGMGVVYRARHAMLRRPTAVKLLPAEKARAHGVQRFEREVQLTAQLSHPNTVAIYDYGRTPDGIFYYAMEYLEGINLEVLVRDFGPQPPARVAHLMRQVAGALGEAHGVGLIHRDIKPANIILCQRGGAPDVAKVVDFGLVKDLDDVRAPEVSALNVIKGTPLYLSPESIRSPETVDGRSDLYALGAVAYYLLAGRNVFEAATVIEVCSHHLHTPPEPPSHKLGRPLPAQLEALILACLEKEPVRRPASAQALVDALLACDDVGTWGEAEALAWWRQNCGRVESVQCKGVKCSDTLNVDLGGRLAEGDVLPVPSAPVH